MNININTRSVTYRTSQLLVIWDSERVEYAEVSDAHL